MATRRRKAPLPSEGKELPAWAIGLIVAGIAIIIGISIGSFYGY